MRCDPTPLRNIADSLRRPPQEQVEAWPVDGAEAVDQMLGDTRHPTVVGQPADIDQSGTRTRHEQPTAG